MNKIIAAIRKEVWRVLFESEATESYRKVGKYSYILSPEDVKENDWFLNTKGNPVKAVDTDMNKEVDGVKNPNFGKVLTQDERGKRFPSLKNELPFLAKWANSDRSKYPKILSTDNPELVAYGVPSFKRLTEDSEQSIDTGEYSSIKRHIATVLIEQAITQGVAGDITIVEEGSARLSRRYQRRSCNTYEAHKTFRFTNDETEYSLVFKASKWCDEDPDGASTGRHNELIIDDAEMDETIDPSLIDKDLNRLRLPEDVRKTVDGIFKDIHDYANESYD